MVGGAGELVHPLLPFSLRPCNNRNKDNCIIIKKRITINSKNNNEMNNNDDEKKKKNKNKPKVIRVI